MKFREAWLAMEAGRVAKSGPAEFWRLSGGTIEMSGDGRVWGGAPGLRREHLLGEWVVFTETARCGDPCYLEDCRGACDRTAGICKPGEVHIHGGKHFWAFDYLEANAPKQCGSVAPSCDWVCLEPHGHTGRHGRKKDNTTASWPNLQELNATIVEQSATIARLEARDANGATLAERHAATVDALQKANGTVAKLEADLRTLHGLHDYWHRAALKAAHEDNRCNSKQPGQEASYCVFALNHPGPYHGNPHALWPKAHGDPVR